MDLQMKKILVDDHIWDFNLEAALNDISAQRKEQALKFKYEQGQRLCVLAYRLLKQGLRELYGIVENRRPPWRHLWCSPVAVNPFINDIAKIIGFR